MLLPPGGIMSFAETLLPEFDQEMANTRKLLACLPDPVPAYKPHDKSMPMNRLAGHVAELPSWAVNAINRDSLDITPKPGQGFEAARSQIAAGTVARL
jgi:hypothetical protein